ncbi:hypothetical protein Tco_0668450 [Tanacetum coccineum]
MEHLEGDVGSLYDEFLRLKASLDVLFVPCYAAAEMSHQGGHVASIWTKGKLKQVGKLLRRVKELVMEKDENTDGIILSLEFSEELKELLHDEAGK